MVDQARKELKINKVRVAQTVCSQREEEPFCCHELPMLVFPHYCTYIYQMKEKLCRSYFQQCLPSYSLDVNIIQISKCPSSTQN